MNKKIKLISTLMIVLFLVCVATSVFATSVGGVTIQPNTTATNDISGIGNKILGIIRVVGIFAAVAILMIVGVKYMMGSAEEKAEYKKVLVPYVLGAVLLFGAAAFADKLVKVAESLMN